MKPFIIAHRGASALALHENSLEAFQIAIDLKADFVEFDIRKTKDNKLVIFHNDSFEGHLLSGLNYDELCTLTGVSGLRPPLFSEVLALCQGKIKLDIELKESGFEKEVVELVKKDFEYDEYMIKSFIDDVVLNIKQIDNKVRTGLLVGRSHLNFFERLSEIFPNKRLKRCLADFISPYYMLATPFFIRRMNRRKTDIYVWTVNKPELISKFLRRNITGIITDRPDIAIQKRQGS